jgi:hypothetical protein
VPFGDTDTLDAFYQYLTRRHYRPGFNEIAWARLIKQGTMTECVSGDSALAELNDLHPHLCVEGRSRNDVVQLRWRVLRAD